MKTYYLKNEEDTRRFGEEFAQTLQPGSVVALIGPLGAGKTTLAKSVARGLGVTETITSPTFTIVQEYETGRLPLYHFDVYRVYDPDELFEMGFEEYLRGNGVCLIEWADLIEDVLPEERVTLKLDYGEEEGERIIEVC